MTVRNNAMNIKCSVYCITIQSTVMTSFICMRIVDAAVIFVDVTVGFTTTTLERNEDASSTLVCVEVVDKNLARDVLVDVFTLEESAQGELI